MSNPRIYRKYEGFRYVPCTGCGQAIKEGEGCEKCLKINRSKLKKKIRDQKWRRSQKQGKREC